LRGKWWVGTHHFYGSLINDLCHGGKFEDPPHKEEDIKEAAKEAIEVVRRFAIGQLKKL